MNGGLLKTDKNFLAEFGQKVHGNGFNIIPLPYKSKSPRVSSWQKITSTSQQIENWLKLGNKGVGVLTKNTPAVDIDVYDKEISEKLRDWSFENIGKTATRIGRDPKMMLIYRTDKSFKKIKSKIYVDFLENENAVEILAEGQQFVAFNVHPDTNKEYRWVGGSSIAEVDVSKLPLITQEKARELVIYFESIAPQDWELKKDVSKSKKQDDFKEDFDNTDLAPDNIHDLASVGGIVDGDTAFLENYKPTVDIDEKDIIESLKYINVDDYDEWYKTGMALHHQFKGDILGLNIWDEWSLQSSKYVKGSCKNKWASFGSQKSANPVTMKSVQFKSKKKKAESLFEEYLERFIYIEDVDSVCDVKKPKHANLNKLNSFKNSKLNESLMEEVKGEEGKKDKKVKVYLAVKWMQAPKRKTAAGLMFRPGEPFVIKDNGFRYINNFYFPDHKKTDSVDKLGIFTDHMDYLFPKKKERKWFIEWMAFKIQRPSERCKVTPLHYSHPQGTGRGWIVELMEELLGNWNCTRVKMRTLAGEGPDAQYHNYFDKSLLCSIEEVKEGDKRFSVSDKIRDLLDAKRLHLNLKFGDNYTANIYTNFFFMTNHSDALAIPETDRRINVFSGPKDPKPMDYYDGLYEWLKDSESLAQLFWYLMRIDLKGFNFKRSFPTAARTNMIENNQSETELLFNDFLESNKKEVLTLSDITKEISSNCEDSFESECAINENQLVRLLKSRGFVNKRVKVKGVMKRLWVLAQNDISNQEIRDRLF